MAEINDNMVSLGTELKINISMEPMDGYTLASTEWFCEFYAKRVKVKVSKEDAIKVDDNNYICTVDSRVVGRGELMAHIEVQIPDSDMDDGLRTEALTFSTGLNIDI